MHRLTLLARLRLRTKLALLLGVCVATFVAITWISASILYQRMIDDRVDKLTAVVSSTLGLAGALEKQEAANQLTHAQALDRFRQEIHAIRYDHGDGFLSVQVENSGIIVAHGTQPAMEGKPGTARDSSGHSVVQLARIALARSDVGVIQYFFPKPGHTRPSLKFSVVARFAPWNVILVAGSYVDDLDAAFHATLWRLGEIVGLVAMVTLLLAWLVNRDITRSLHALLDAMDGLAKGRLDTAIPGTGRRDEVGTMAAAVLVFRNGLAKAEHLSAEQEAQRMRADAEKRAALRGMADTIETQTGAAIAQIDGRAESLAETAEGMSASASRTGVSAQSAADAAAQALQTAQTVASAAEQLAASIREIGGQVSQSSAAVGRAVEAGTRTRATIDALNQQVMQIGSVADMIGEIAGKTNLLALNATIEAARAGEAGKGFAVVASEVKALATQTAHSTKEITRHLAEVRQATGASVEAVADIERTISEVNTISGSIAAAVEEQGAATQEIARTIGETAAAARTMSQRTTEVSAEADETKQRAGQVLEYTGAMETSVRALRDSVIRTVRSATDEAA